VASFLREVEDVESKERLVNLLEAFEKDLESKNQSEWVKGFLKGGHFLVNEMIAVLNRKIEGL